MNNVIYLFNNICFLIRTEIKEKKGTKGVSLKCTKAKKSILMICICIWIIFVCELNKEKLLLSIRVCWKSTKYVHSKWSYWFFPSFSCNFLLKISWISIRKCWFGKFSTFLCKFFNYVCFECDKNGFFILLSLIL